MTRGAAPGAARDDARLDRVLALAAPWVGRTAPNPAVGCVIVDRRGTLLAEGVHRGPGTPHAEVDALARLGHKARGATLYVNLEPCNHHGRTPPCALAVAAAGIARVVVGARDPIASHAGGIALLRRAGVEVVVGVREAACRELNRGFYTWASKQRPWLTLKTAITLDGRIATRTGASKWITGDAARAEVMQLRARHDAVMVGIGTMRADDPQLTVRSAGGRAVTPQPVRVVVDARLDTAPTAKIFRTGGGGILLAATGAASVRRQRALRDVGAEVIVLPSGRDGRVPLPALLRELARRGITSVLCEGGAEIAASLVAARAIDELHVYVAPKLFGGRGTAGGPSWLGGAGITTPAQAARYTYTQPPRLVGDDLHLVLRPRAR